MKRRSFLKLGLLATAAAAVGLRPSKATVSQPPPTLANRRDDLLTWYGSILREDRDLPEDTVFFIVQTRLHEGDLASRVTQNARLSWSTSGVGQ